MFRSLLGGENAGVAKLLDDMLGLTVGTLTTLGSNNDAHPLQVAHLLETVNSVTTAAANEELPLENRIILSIAHSLQGIGRLTPSDDFVTQEIGKLLVRINNIVKHATNQKFSDGLKFIECTGEGISGLTECIVRIIKGIDSLVARNVGVQKQPRVIDVPVRQRSEFSEQMILTFSRKNHTKDIIKEMPLHVQDAIENAANISVLVVMDALYKLCELLKNNLDQDLIVTKIPQHLIAEVYVEMVNTRRAETNHAQKLFAEIMRIYYDNETIISNIAGLAFIVGSLHMLYNIEYNIPTTIAAATVAKLNYAISTEQSALLLAAFALTMVVKDNVLPGALLMLAAWAAVVPSLVEKDVLAAMVESKYHPATRHPSLRL